MAETTETETSEKKPEKKPRPRPKPRKKPVYLVDGARTPFLRARGKPGPFTPVDLAVQAGRPLLLRQPFEPDTFDQVILGCVNVVADEMNPARVAALRLGMGHAMPAFTVQVNCGSGMQSIDTAFRYIQAGQSDLILAGGTEALSHSPLIYNRQAVEWFGKMMTAKTVGAKLKALISARPSMLTPVIGLERGLTDPIVELNMGQTAELLAQMFDISREQMDSYAFQSHQRLAKAHEAGHFKDEMVSLIDRNGGLYDYDDGVRPDTTLEKFGTLKPVFERPYGKVTAGNASQITDGASWVILASEEAVEKYQLEPLARLVDTQWSALDPAIMGLGPVLSSTELLKRQRLKKDDIDLWEINEAFAAQVLACQAAWDDTEFCREVLHLRSAFGAIDPDKLNIDGGAISMGHPVGTSGNRLVLHLAQALKREGGKRGVASQCVGGGLGGSVLLEAMS
ncbi:acetyl-CoA C-acetyltransferase [Marinimicrobium alkaliphilum]|uniref:acetyl-CoA C-acetyltransferase n=1 Tax=Marinimicrobium alkaliphilum TaxID=2202654 RepID=UPI000DB9C091|nr:acetyl-CoA C-acetyltransferase [Marinimicrobium alkaliphilum]